MVKIKTITHTPTSTIIHTPLTFHPFSRAREFQRAYTATKIDRIFAKPFLHNFQGHSDGISALGKSTLLLNKFISGSHDG
jgi:WD repeat and SOF domain-containing protein 1